jgi:hypothetical protein
VPPPSLGVGSHVQLAISRVGSALDPVAIIY